MADGVLSATGAAMRSTSLRQGVCACAVSAALVLCADDATAAASLIGDEVAIGYFYPTFDSLLGVQTVVVDGGFEAECPGASFVCDILLAYYRVDIGANTITFFQSGTELPYNPGEVNGWEFSGLDFGRGIDGVRLTSFGLPGLDLDDVSFTEDSVFVSLLDVRSSVGLQNSFTVELIEVPPPPPPPPPPEPIPLPVSFFGLASALAGIGGIRLLIRIKNKQRATGAV